MISINIEKAKQISHEARRRSRSKEFAPYDEIISKQIPGSSIEEAEGKRQLIRDKYSSIQEKIDSARNALELKLIMESFLK